MTFAELVVKFKSEGANNVKKDTDALGSSLTKIGAAAGAAGVAAGAVLEALKAVAGAAIEAGKAIAEARLEYDSSVRALAMYQTNAADLSAQLQRLEKIARLPGLGMQEVMQGVVALEAAGFSAKLAERSVKAFGNALALAGKGKAELAGITLALQQIASKGKVSAEEINQIAERAPQFRAAMQKAFGTSSSEEIQKLGITAQEFIGKTLAEMEKLPAAGNSLANAMENAKQVFLDAQINIGQGFEDMFMKGSGAGSSFMALITEASNGISAVLTSVAESPTWQAIMKNVKQVIDNLREIAPIFKMAFQMSMATLLGFFKAGMETLAAFTKAYAAYAKDPIGYIKNEFTTLGEQIKAVLNNALVEVLGKLRVFLAAIDKVTGSNLAGMLPQMSKMKVPEATVGQKALMSLGNLNGVTAGRYAAQAMKEMEANDRPFQRRLPNDLTFGKPPAFPGGGGTSGADKDKDKADKDKKHKEASKQREKQAKSLEKIEGHTKTAEMTLREFSYGGGVMGGRVLSKSDLYAKSINAPMTSWNTDLDKGITKLIRSYNNNNSLNLNFRRA